MATCSAGIALLSGVLVRCVLVSVTSHLCDAYCHLLVYYFYYYFLLPSTKEEVNAFALIRLSVSLSLSKITQKRMHEFG